MKLSDYLDPLLVKVPLVSRAKLDAITELVDLIAAHGGTSDRARLLDAVLARERQRTTAIGRGLAVPHAKSDCCGRLVVALGRTAEPIDFDAIDRKPVQFVVLLASPLSMAPLQIQILAKVSRLVLSDDTFSKILAAPTAAELVAVIRAFEAA